MNLVYKTIQRRLEKLPANTVLVYGETWGDNCGCLLAATTPGVSEETHPDYQDVLNTTVKQFDSRDAEDLLQMLVNVYDETCNTKFGTIYATTADWVQANFEGMAKEAEQRLASCTPYCA